MASEAMLDRLADILGEGYDTERLGTLCLDCRAT